MSYYKRLFRLFDKGYPFSLRIKYFNPHESFSSSPVVTTGSNVGVSVHDSIELYSLITRRYKTEKDCIDEIKAIELKTAKLDAYIKKKQDKINS